MGRRKTWLVPVQFAAAAVMLYTAGTVDTLLDGSVEDDFRVQKLTAIFFGLYLLMATQDIAVDGWALSMLSKENVELGSTCNTIGQNLGYFISFVGFLAFNNPDVCNAYFRPLLGKEADADTGMVSLGDFFYFFGGAMAITTCMVAVFKKERATAADEVDNMSEAYSSMYTAAKQPMVQKLFLVLLTYRVGFAVADNVTHLKMIEYGFKKERIAMVTPLLLPLSLITPIIAKRSGYASLTVWLMAYKWRLLIGLVDAGIVYYIGVDMDTAFYGFVALSIVWTTVSSMMFTAQMEFFAKAAAENPTIGGAHHFCAPVHQPECARVH